MSNRFHTMRKDGSELVSSSNLADAMDKMGHDMLMFLGGSDEALRVAVALGRAARDRKSRLIGVGTLLEIGLQAEEGK